MKAKYNDPIIFIGGDLNRRDIAPVFDEFADIERKFFDPTRLDACLDVMFGNFEAENNGVFAPLYSQNGTPSDHSCVVFNVAIKKEKNFTWVKKTARKHSREAVAAFKSSFEKVNWSEIMRPNMSPDELVKIYEDTVNGMVDSFFPMKTVRCRSNESPWITDGIRKLARKKNRVYRMNGKSERWLRLQEKMDEMILHSREEFVARGRSRGNQKLLQSCKRTKCWLLPSTMGGL